MRILFISAFYPPFVIGGWEQLVRDVNNGLQTRGHTTHVLTSTFGLDKPVHEQGIDRILTLESDVYHYQPLRIMSHGARLKNNLAQTESVIKSFKPDIVFIHVMWNLSKGIAWTAERLCLGRVVYYIANDWPYATDVHSAYWRDPAKNKIMGKLKALSSPLFLKAMEQENNRFPLEFKRVLCVSQAVKENLTRYANIDGEHMKVVYNGIEDELFTPLKEPKPDSTSSLSLLYAGSLVPHKGVHTAIEALAILSRNSDISRITLSINGSGHPDYEEYLKKLVKDNDLSEKVHFLYRVPREEMPGLMQKFDVLVFPSTWEEPLARVMQEAMATGLTVVGTLTGGTGELLVDGETGLAFPPSDAAALAEKIQYLYNNPDIRLMLAKNGRRKVLSQFTMKRMLDEVEMSLYNAVDESADLGRSHGTVVTPPAQV